MKVRIGYAPGALPSGPEGQGALRGLVEIGDRLGYDSIWLSDHVVGDRFPLEPLVALSMIAAYSDTLKFGTSVLALPLRNPVLLAKQLASLDYLSAGRLLPAVGLGSDDQLEYEACGVPMEGRAERTDEAIALLRRLWQEDAVTHQGRFFTLRQVSVVPKPAQQPSPPIWIGGRSRAAQRRVGRLGDGWLASQVTPQEVARGIEVIFATAAEHHRAVDPGHIGVLLGFYLDPSPARAAAHAQPHLFRARPDLPSTEYSALGPPDAIAALIQAYVAAGATKFVVRPLCPPEEAIKQLELFGREVLPRFHHP